MGEPLQAPVQNCFSLPTEKLGFPSQLCVEVDQENRKARVYLLVFGVQITIGEVSETDTSVTVDLGPVISGIGGTVTAFLHTNSMCLSVCFNLKYSSGKITVAQFLVFCSIFSAHPQFSIYPNTQIEVLSDCGPICGQATRSCNDFFIKQPDTYIIETEKGVRFKLYQKAVVGNDILLGIYQNGGPKGVAPYPLHLKVGSYYIGDPEGTEKAFTVVFKRISQ